MQALLERFRELGARPLHELGVAGARKAVRGSRALQGTPEPVAAVEDVAVDSPGGDIAVRVYRPEGGASSRLMVVYLHGGGWVTGGIEEADGPCRSLVNAWGCVVASVDYRLSPETPYPGALEDVLAAVTWLGAHRQQLGAGPGRLVLVGESAGGTLATAACLRGTTNQEWPVSELVLFYPPLARRPARPGEGDGSTLTARDMAWFWDLYLGSAAGDDPYAVPLLAQDLRSMPPTVLVTAEADILREEGVTFAARLRAAGVSTTHLDVPGMVHGFLGMLGALPSARGVLETVRTHLGSISE